MSTQRSASRVRGTYEFIKAHRTQYSVQAMCRVLAGAPSGYYEWLQQPISNRAREDARLLHLIRASSVASHGIYGAPRVFLDLREAGETCSKHRVARLMLEASLRALHGYRTRRWAVGKPSVLIPNLLQRQFTVTRANKAWVTDITYIRTWQGWLYLAVVMDLFSRLIVGWAAGPTIHREIVLNAVLMAVRRRRPRGTLIHSDQGTQYGSDAWRRTGVEGLRTLPHVKSMPSTVRLAVLAAAGFCVLAIPIAAGSKPSLEPRTAFVELDAVVLDKNDYPVVGLQQGDFQVKEDGRPVVITSFNEVSAAGITGPADGRTVVMLLDDNTVPLSATTAIQNIARLFMSYARPADTVGVIRLTHRDDEAAGSLQAALDRIADYHSYSVSFFGWDMRDDALQTVARVARQLQPVVHRRKVLVCIGNRDTCDPYLEVPENSIIWPSWRDALKATARANASVYFVSPAGVESRFDLGYGLVDNSGGGDFARSNDFRRAARMIWEEAGHYYLLGYTPTARPRDLHTIDVSMRRSGLHLHVRRRRGD